MREYREDRKLTKVVCNACGKNLLVENGILKEECIRVDHDFGFFGSKDGESDSFDLCEACYEKLIVGFAVPVERRERKELL
ncbi:MAG: hypothetical protein OSJ59_07625 [Lachnospiraceae bacterium]|nr:hypothetical protein [Lachnospiraceae bacterium]